MYWYNGGISVADENESKKNKKINLKIGMDLKNNLKKGYKIRPNTIF